MSNILDDALTEGNKAILTRITTSERICSRRCASDLEIQIADLLYITSLVQLATRHPGVSTQLRNHGLAFGQAVSQHFAHIGLPALAALVQAGNDANQDIQPQRQQQRLH